ncbi:MAG: hypothetical protein KDB23_25995 [Planctomycetales bacterium]|nr:hypothetical protein [Planctomycetales bacterium]
MATEPSVIRAISWRDLCPWTLLFRLYRLSLTLQFLILAYLGAWAVSLGWDAASAVILTDTTLAKSDVRQFLNNVSYWPESSLELQANAASQVVTAIPSAVNLDAGSPATRMLTAAWQKLGHSPMYSLAEPLRRLFDPALSWNEFLFYLFGAVWTLVVWAWLGGAITRAAAVRLGRDERVGLRDSLEFSQRKLLSSLGAVLLPLGAIVAVSIPLFMLGLIMRLNIGVALGGILWGLVALAGLVMSLFAVGILFGWPLMWPAIGTEGSDAFDAISRSYAYTFQKPLHYLGYVSVATILGFLGWLIVGIFCESVVQFGMWGVGNGAGAERMATIRAAVDASAPPVITDTTAGLSVRGEPVEAVADAPVNSGMVAFGSRWICFVNRTVMGVQVAYGYSFMWSAAAAIYLLLRRDADQAELDDIYVEEESGVTYGLPALKEDDAGVAGVDAEVPDAIPPATAENES